MRKEKDYMLLSYFRANARDTLTKISKKTSIPVSTIFDRLRNYERNLILKHTSLLDFRKLGFDVKAQILFKIDSESIHEFKKFVSNHQRTNSVYRVNNGYDFMVEALFTNLQDLDEFFTQAHKHGVEEKKEFFVLEDVKREAFLSNTTNFEHVDLPQLINS